MNRVICRLYIITLKITILFKTWFTEDRMPSIRNAIIINLGYSPTQFLRIIRVIIKNKPKIGKKRVCRIRI